MLVAVVLPLGRPVHVTVSLSQVLPAWHKLVAPIQEAIAFPEIEGAPAMPNKFVGVQRVSVAL